MYKHFDNLVLAAVAVVGCALGIWGFETCNYGIAAHPSYAACQTSGFIESLYKTIMLVRGGGNYTYPAHPIQLLIAQFAIPAVTIWAIIKLFLAGIRRDLRVFLARSKHNHTIVCGLGATGMRIVDGLLQSERQSGWLNRLRRRYEANVVVIDANAENPFAATCERQGVPVLVGDASQSEVLLMAGIMRAQSVIICTGDDAANLDMAPRIRELADGNRKFLKRRLSVLIELQSEWFFSKFVDENGRNLGSAVVDLRFFNAYDIAARLLMQKVTPPPDPYLEGGSFVIFGFGSMGREIVLSLLRSSSAPLGGKPSIVIFDRTANEAGRNFLRAYPAAETLGDISFRESNFQPSAADWTSDIAAELGQRPIQAVFVCLPDDATSLTVGLELRHVLDASGYVRPPIYIRLRKHRRLGRFLDEVASSRKSGWRLETFGALEELLDPQILFADKLDRLAVACHEQYLKKLPQARTSHPANRPWVELAESFKSANRRKADHIQFMLAQIGLEVVKTPSPLLLSFTGQEVELLAQLEHRRWSAEMMLHGWSFGTSRNQTWRKNENLAAWESIPEDVRAQNREEIAALPAILAAAGLEIKRSVRMDVFSAATKDLPLLATGAAETNGAETIVFADLNRPESRALAEDISIRPSTRLWLVGGDPPLHVLQQHPEAARQITALIEHAQGWARPAVPMDNAAKTPDEMVR